MPRRVSLPGADELFRTTGGPALPAARPVPEPGSAEERLRAVPTITEPALAPAPPITEPAAGIRGPRMRPRERRPTGRERHDEKITVYVSSEELIDLEQTRITLRGEHGLAVDRGRLVREAVAMMLADFEANGESSGLVRRLRGV